MAVDPVKNFAYGIVVSGAGLAGTGLQLQTGQGNNFPSTASGSFNVAAWPANQLPTVSNTEILRVTNRSSDNFTVLRSQEGSSAVNITVGYQIAQTITANLIAEMVANGVTSFNTRTGAVTLTKSDVTGTGLTYSDVGADASGAAASVAASVASTYAPLASPALSGSPTAPTQTAGDNSTKVATTAFVTAAIAAAVAGLSGVSASWPVNSVFIGYTATNPYTLLGVGTSTSSWVQIAQGQMLVGQHTGDPNFGTLGNTGGAVTTSLSTANLPPHTHGWGNSSNTESGTHYHTGSTYDDSSEPHDHGSVNLDSGGYGFVADGGDHQIQDGPTGTQSASHTHVFSTGTEVGTHYHTGTTDNGAGSSTAFSILSPFLTVYIWRRVS